MENFNNEYSTRSDIKQSHNNRPKIEIKFYNVYGRYPKNIDELKQFKKNYNPMVKDFK